MIRAKAWWIAAGLVVAAPSHAEDFDNNSVIALAKAGLGTDVLLAKVASLPCSYDVSTGGIVALKRAGVPNAVIAAMVDRCTGSSTAQGAAAIGSDPATMHSPGLYIDQGGGGAHRLERIRPTNISGARVSGNGSILFPFRATVAVPRAAAQTIAPGAKPDFYFYFETDNSKVGDFGTYSTHSAQSPSEFSLVRFKVKDGQRETSMDGGTVLSRQFGANPKDGVEFSIRELADGIFAVTPKAPLPPGDYGFMLQGEKGSYRFYDFQVPAR